MKIFKLLTNDVVLFCINLLILASVYHHILYSQDFNIFIEISLLALFYYLISLSTSLSILLLLYLKVKSTFGRNVQWSIFKKLEIMSYIFSEYFDEINCSKDLDLKVKEITR